MAGAVAFSRSQATETIDFDGAAESADLVFYGVEADDLGEFHFHQVVGWDERVFNLFDFVFFDGSLFLFSCDSDLMLRCIRF